MKNKGITLIALVITIVVLIILAAVAINLSLGNNGIFNRAKTAKEQYSNAQEQETTITQSADEIDSHVDGYRGYEEKINELQARIEALEKANSYSKEEQLVGTYLDGKPLYKKTVTGKTSTTNGGFIGIWNAGANSKMIFADGWVTATNGVRCPICYDDSNRRWINLSF